MSSTSDIVHDLGSKLDELQDLSTKKIKSLEHIDQIEPLRIELLGKKGSLTTILKDLGKVPPASRSIIGQKSNQLKKKLENELQQAKINIQENYYNNLEQTEYIDVTLPKSSTYTPSSANGTIHPISIVQNKLEKIFTSMGFSIVYGPHIELDLYNFEALNFTDDHPAREMQDTFYTTDKTLLRTHTSSVQVRFLKKEGIYASSSPPCRIISPGRVFRHEEVDPSHEHTFYQMEGMIIDENISVANLLSLMETLMNEIFLNKIEVRLRPGYFPFVEPGFELDIQCQICYDPDTKKNTGCKVCKYTHWVELLPCGLVHPNVLEASGLSPKKWQGAAFGLGLTRLAMMLYGIDDIRYFQNPNISFLQQFKQNL